MRRLVLLATVAVVVVLLVVAQLVLPGIAAQRLRDRLKASGTVLAVEVHAFPAIELLWHRADRVVVRMGQYRSSPGRLANLISEAADAGSLDASASELDTGLLRLRDATMHKHADELTGAARVTEADLRASLPILQSVQPVASSGGQLTLRGIATLLGVTVTIDATVRPQDGQLVVTPDIPFGGFATLVVFSNPHLAVQSVAATPLPRGFTVSARARLH